MAALAVVGAILMGCAGEDMANEAPQAKSGNKVIQTTTISLGGSAGTRALDADGKKTFAVGDQIAIYYKNTSDKLQLANSAALTANDISSDGKTATITVEMTDPKPESQLRYIYPAAMAITDYDPAEEIGNTINYEELSNAQDGTLATLASTCDLAVYDGKLTSNSELPGSATLKNQLAIAEFTIKDYSGNDITSLITQLDIAQGSNKVIINRTAAAGPIYVAMLPSSNVNVIIIASDGKNSYKKTAASKTLAASTMTPVNLSMWKVVDLSTLTAHYEAKNGEMLTGTLDGLNQTYKISIADGAVVALGNAIIDGYNDTSIREDSHCAWAGITCLGDATIILEDGSTNTVKGFLRYYPGIFVPENKTLTIKGETAGTGSLTASCSTPDNGYGAGIGGGPDDTGCGNIVIESGNITTIGGMHAAGIGGYHQKSCGDITISGGTIMATGGFKSAGIGSSHNGKCGNITIANTVTMVTAKKSTMLNNQGINSIGRGSNGTCGTVTIGGTVYWNGSDYQNGGDTYLTINTLVFPVPDPVVLSAVTSSQLGWMVGSDGKAYAVGVPTGVTAVAKIFYVGNDAESSTTYNHGLALALSDANDGNRAQWCGQTSANCLGTQCSTRNDALGDMAGIANTDALVNNAPTGHTHDAANAARNYNCPRPDGTSEWFLPSAGQWQKMIDAIETKNLRAIAGLQKDEEFYWSSTEMDGGHAWGWNNNGKTPYYLKSGDDGVKTAQYYVRACFAF